MGFVVRCDRIVAGRRVLDGYVRVRDGRIAEVGAGEPRREPGEAGHDLRGRWLVPGLIDLHVHGVGGWDTYDPVALGAGGGPDPARGLARLLAVTGTTACWPTLATAAPEDMEAACRYWGAAVRAHAAEGGAGDPPGARLLGLHLEGPFLNPARAGAQDPGWMCDPDPERWERLWAAAGGTVRRVTLAPERPGARALARLLARRGIRVAAGHTDATYEEMAAARAAGVTLVTHAYNAMRGLHPREPGALGAALDPALALDCELVADGVHVHPAAMRILWALKGPDRLAAVSDAVAAALLPPGSYDLRAFRVTVTPDGQSRLADGTLAGSTATLLDGLRVLVTAVGLAVPDAVACVTSVPAAWAGVAHRKGRIAPGCDADLVAVDEGWRAVAVWVEGRPAFPPGEPPDPRTLVHPGVRRRVERGGPRPAPTGREGPPQVPPAPR